MPPSCGALAIPQALAYVIQANLQGIAVFEMTAYSRVQSASFHVVIDLHQREEMRGHL
jgi:hypothetical protein